MISFEAGQGSVGQLAPVGTFMFHTPMLIIATTILLRCTVGFTTLRLLQIVQIVMLAALKRPHKVAFRTH